MNVLVSGDWHGFIESAEFAIDKARDNLCDVIVQCGDFGFAWRFRELEDIGKEDSYAELQDMAKRAGVEIYWLDGNHENFDLIEHWKKDLERDHNGMYPLSENIYYSPRGNTFNLGKTKCMTLGGAYSIDKEGRTPHISWWPQEMITGVDLMKVREGGYVDILFTHDAPIPPPQNHTDHRSIYDKSNQEAIQYAMEMTMPAMLFHGHYHHKKRWFWEKTQTDIYSLGIKGDDMCHILENL